MSTLEHLSHNLREGLDSLAEGWQHLWQKTRQAITRFTPSDIDAAEKSSGSGQSYQWGVLSADVFETDREIKIQLEAPGMSAADFQISIDNLTLNIRGERRYQRDDTQGQYHISERAYGRFERVVPLPAPVDSSGARATYRDGILSITAPKAPGAMGRRISIEDAN